MTQPFYKLLGSMEVAIITVEVALRFTFLLCSILSNLYFSYLVETLGFSSLG
jgi:hypothetical protein